MPPAKSREIDRTIDLVAIASMFSQAPWRVEDRDENLFDWKCRPPALPVNQALSPADLNPSAA